MIDSIQSRYEKLKIILILYKPNDFTAEILVTSKKLSTVSARLFKKADPNSRSTDFTDKSSEDKNIEISFSNMQDSISNSLKIIDLKQKISDVLEIKLDQIILYTFSQNAKKIQDNEEIYEYLSKTENNRNDPNFFFYAISNATSKVNLDIEYHINNISTINLDLNLDCSIYMLKYFINQNIEGRIPINEQMLKVLSISHNNQISTILPERALNNASYCSNKSVADREKEKDTSSFLNNASIYFPMTYTEKELTDEDSLSDIIQFYSNQENLCLQKNEINIDANPQEHTRLKNLEGYSINFLLFQKSGKKITMGIDFSFNILKDLIKLPFSSNAPLYCEASDGLNIFFNCKNPKCKIFEKMFVKNLSFGKFNIKAEISSIRCVKCYSKNIVAINIGFVYCNWKYSGIITNKKSSYVSGDGITIDDSIYIMKELNILACFTRLEIRVKEVERKLQSISSYESDIALGDIVEPVKKSILNNENNLERTKTLKGINRVSTLIFQETDEQFSKANQNKYEIGYRKKEKVIESLYNSKMEDKDCKLLKEKSYKNQNLISSNNSIDVKNDRDTQEINYDHKKHSECCNYDLSVVQNLKANCLIF